MSGIADAFGRAFALRANNTVTDPKKLLDDSARENAPVGTELAATATPAGGDLAGAQVTTSATAPQGSLGARGIALAQLGVAGLLAALVSYPASAFKPTSGFVLFAGFYVAAQAIERLLEFVLPSGAGTKQAKADRTLIVGALATLLGVGLSLAFGLYFLRAVGLMPGPGWLTRLDIFVTGLVIGGGTKPLHDLIGLIQKAS